MNKRILFLLPTFSQPRYQKRVISYRNKGYSVLVASFDRNKYLINRPREFDFHYLGKIHDGLIFRRIPALWKCLKYIIRNRKQFDYIYAFGFDLAFVAFLIRAQPFIYEIGDVQWVNYRGIKRIVFSALDKVIISKAEKCVITSNAFYTNVFKPMGLSMEKFFLIENKVSATLANHPRTSSFNDLSRDTIKISYVGSLRYKSYVTILCETVLKNEKYELNFYGDDGGSLEAIRTFSSLCKRIRYHGPFRNPDDLPQIYNNTHLNFACYEINRENERIALPNKLYESGYFAVPILVSQGTYLAEIVTNLNLGYVLDFNNREETFEFFATIDLRKVAEMHTYIVNNLHKNKFLNEEIIFEPCSTTKPS